MRNDDSFGHGGSSEDDEKWSDSGNIFKKSQKNWPTAWIWDVREKKINQRLPKDFGI